MTSRDWLGSVSAAVLLLAVASGVSPAADRYWSGTGTWDTTATNWGTVSGGPYDQATWSNAAPDAAIFQGTAGTVTLGEAITAGGVTFEVGGYTLTSDTLTLSTTGTGITATGSATIDSAVALSGNQSWSVATGETLTLGGVVSGTSTLTYGGLGTYEVNAVNTASGSLTINAATVTVGSSGVLMASGFGFGGFRSVTLTNGATLAGRGLVILGQVNDAAGNIVFGSGGGTFRATDSADLGAANKGFTVNDNQTGVFEVPTGVDASWSGSFSGRDFQVSSGGTLEFDIDGSFTTSRFLQGAGAVRKVGAGTLESTGVNSFSGGLLVSAGTFNANANTGSGSASAIGAAGNAVTVDAGGTLLFSIARGAGFHTGPATINGGTITANAGDQNFVSGNTLTFDTAAGLFDGTGQWRRRNAGNKVAVTAAASGSTISVADLNLFDGSPEFEVADGIQTADLTISSVISGSSLTKTGAGTLTATTVNTFSGGLVINAGTFQAASTTSGTGDAGALGARGNAVTVNAGGRLEFTVGRAAGFHNGSVTVNGGTISFNSGDNSLASSNTMTLGTAAGTIDGSGQWRFRGGATLRVLAAADGSTLSTSTVDLTEGNQTFNVDTGATLTVSSGLTNDFGGFYNKAGGGTMAITTVQSNYGGSVTINAGTLDIAVGTSGGNASGLGSGNNSVAVGQGATLLFSGGGRTAGFHGGAVTVNNGTITFNTSDNSFANGQTVTLDVGPGTIDGTGQWRRRNANNRVAVTAAASGSVISVADLNLLDNSPVFEVADGAQANDLTISGGITGGSTLTKTGTGTLAVTGSNTSFTGATAINAGTLVVGDANALGTSGSITIGASSTFGVAAGVAFSRPLTITAGGRVNLGDGATVALPDAASLSAFESVSPAGAATSAEILFGSGGTTPTALTSGWFAKPAGSFSDILSLEGTGAGNTYVLSMSYDGSFGDMNIWYRPGTTGPFTPVGTSFEGETAWNSGFQTVGQYGVDTATSTVWVVTDHNSQFVIVPEPTAGLLAFGGVAAAAAVARLRRRRAAG